MIEKLGLALVVGLLTASTAAVGLPLLLRRLPSPEPVNEFVELSRPFPILVTAGLAWAGVSITLPWLPVPLWPP